MERILSGQESELPQNQDTTEQLEIHKLILDILDREEGPFFFIDLHTTSGETIPFLTVNDTLLNRKFSLQFPVPSILGIEEFLDGPLLSYINYLGYIAVGFESGQHDDPTSIENHVAFAMLSCVFTGCLSPDDFPDFKHYYTHLAAHTLDTQNIFEITFRYEIAEDEQFKMRPNFDNFQKLNKGAVVATSNGTDLRAIRNGRMFMPLYQAQGNDGFFIVRKTPAFFLRFSSFLRRIRFDRFVAILPGVRWADEKKDTLRINLKVARFFTKEFFHLMGYRSRREDDTHLYAKNRETSSLHEDYKNVRWFKNGQR